MNANISVNIYLWIILLVSICFAGQSRAAIILDQEHIATNKANILIDSSRQYAQIFTVGQTGNLDSIELQIYKRGTPPNNLNFDLRNVIGSTPDQFDANAIATFSLGESVFSFTSYSFASIDLSNLGIAVNSGDAFALVAHSFSNSLQNAYLWGQETYTDGVNPYSGGSACTRATSINNWACYNSSGFQQDFGFRAFVNTNPVPVPATLWLFGSALLGLLGVRKRA